MRLLHLSVLSTSTLTLAADLTCDHIRTNGYAWDISALSGPHSVYHIEHQPPSIANTTFTIDLCQSLELPKNSPKGDHCPNHTRVCAIKRVINKEDDKEVIEKVIPVAGNFDHGRPMNPGLTRLRDDDDEEGKRKGEGREGLRIELHGGRYPWSAKAGRRQMAIVELVCSKDGGKRRTRLRRAASPDGEDNSDGDDEGSGDEDLSDTKGLKFVSYGAEKKDGKDLDVLRLEWVTEHACEGRTGKDDSEHSRNHWGLFTWFIIMSVLSHHPSLSPPTRAKSS